MQTFISFGATANTDKQANTRKNNISLTEVINEVSFMTEAIKERSTSNTV